MIKKLKIINIDKYNYNYTLLDTNNKSYEMNIQFYGLEMKPKINDYIYIGEEILREINFFSFGVIKDNEIREDELIKLVSEDKEFYLQRYYG